MRKFVLTYLPRGRRAAIVVSAVAVAVLVAAAVAVLRGGSDAQTFVGRFHPLLVHLPIGFLLLTAVVEGLSRTERHAGTERLMPVLLGLGAASTCAAIVTGLLLARSGQYDEELVARHQSWGLYLGLTVAVACAAAWLRATRIGRGPQALFGASFAASLVVVGITGHLGGSLTHGETYLTEHLPHVPFLTRAQPAVARGPVDPSATPVFQTLVAPTLHARCVTCHGPSRQSGKLRLDSAESIRKGGESGPVLVAGDSARSELVRRVFLPATDKKAMPPRGHAAPTHAEMAVLRWWIDQGASFDQVLADAQVLPELETAIIDRLGPVDFSAPAILSVRVAPGDPKAIDALRALKLRVEPLRSDSALLYVQAPPAARTFSDADLKALEALATQIAWLDLGGTQVTDKGLVPLLPRLVNLWKLSLDRTAAGDKTLEAVAGLQRLESMNVYATQVTDEGLDSLEKMPRLRSVYAWQTQVTAQRAEALQGSMKRVHVTLGAPPAPVVEEPKDGKRRQKKTSTGAS